MNEYKIALNIIKIVFKRIECPIEPINKIEELVKKATPTKPNKYGGLDIGRCNTNDILFDFCPNCGGDELTGEESGKLFKHCADCGQAIDWSTDE